MKFIKALLVLFTDSFFSWLDHRGASKGAALAFYALFSLAPILILTIAVAGFFFGDAAAQGQIIHQIENLVGHNGAVAIQAILAAAKDPAGEQLTTLVAIVLLLIGATSVFTELKASLDELWGVPKSKLSAMSILLRTRLLSFGLVLVLTFLLLISLVVSTLLSVFEQYVGSIWGGSALLFTILTSFISFCVIACLFAVIYKILPDKRLSWQDVAIGSIFTACLFTLGKYLIGLYISKSAVASSFGAAGSVIAILIWVYYSAQILFLGAEFTRQFALRFGSLKQYKQQQLELDRVNANPLKCSVDSKN
ncbi:YihY/virulence factor BrkB family protein [Methylotenera sp.]|uniref:YihY/virulence factor BrkB family protein n=1 Tax=Methylotenera sp. TaxID=2051956 RepID=UPI00248717F9|nr:YihY/virulence factor BrkB family protein [Methylotenera sp.]MDI1298488.1 YihY/virulence factor BrkB family protein [Methylotenera sp.]